MAHGGFKDVLKNGGFQAFLWTQFLGAFNDNAYRIIVSLRAVHWSPRPTGAAIPRARRRRLRAAVPAVLRIRRPPGRRLQQAPRDDRRQGFRDRRDVAGPRGLLLADRMDWMLVVLFLMAVHSTVFSPAKYGIVPEMVEAKDLSRANAPARDEHACGDRAGHLGRAVPVRRVEAQPWKIGVVLISGRGRRARGQLGITRVPAAGRARAVSTESLRRNRRPARGICCAIGRCG